MLKNNNIPYLFLFFLITSCQWFSKEVPNEEDLLKAELNKINFNQVDQYPSMALCDSLTDLQQQKDCFFSSVTQIIQERLSIDTLQILYPQVDTLQILITIRTNETVHFALQKPKDSVTYNLAEIDSIIKNKLSNFPPVQPAIYRGLKVNSQFTIPIVLQVQE